MSSILIISVLAIGVAVYLLHRKVKKLESQLDACEASVTTLHGMSGSSGGYTQNQQ